MQLVHLQQSHRIYLFFNEFLIPEIPGNIQHQAPVPHDRPVRHDAGFKLPAAIKHLPEALNRIECAFRRNCFYFNAFRRNLQAICRLTDKIFFRGKPLRQLAVTNDNVYVSSGQAPGCKSGCSNISFQRCQASRICLTYNIV